MSKTIFAMTAAALIGAATFAAAGPSYDTGSYFALPRTAPASSVLDVSLVTTTGAGIVSIYDFKAGVQGDLLGQIPVNAGANADLRINLGVPPQNDVIGVLTIGGQVAATQVFDVTTR
jgi:hypothetical protein